VKNFTPNSGDGLCVMPSGITKTYTLLSSLLTLINKIIIFIYFLITFYSNFSGALTLTALDLPCITASATNLVISSIDLEASSLAAIG